MAAITPLVSKWVDDKGRQAFTLDQQDAFGFQLTTNDGFGYLVNPEYITVDFKYRLRLQNRSAQPPTLEMMSRPAPYTEVLPEISRRLIEVVKPIIGAIPRTLVGIGVISTTVVSESEAPPGIRRFLEHVARPWSASLSAYNLHLTADLAGKKDGGAKDRCTHTLTKSEEGDDNFLTIRLDWMRTFDEKKPPPFSTLEEQLKLAQKEALEYFEDIGQGDRFDENIRNARS
jgi:hypothetical protein